MMIKICGITREEDALVCADAGATAIGFNFCRRSPRYVKPEAAADIGKGLPLLRVGVFVDESPEMVKRVMREAALDVAQLHGAERPSWKLEGARLWKAFRVAPQWQPSETSSYAVEAILLDGPLPGSGEAFDWSQAAHVTQRLILAGGLDETNIAAAIEIVKPWGVDACSKLENAPGIKDHSKIRRFVNAAQEQTA